MSIPTSNENWNWNRETLAKAQGLKPELSSFQTIAVFIITKNIVDMVHVLATKLQREMKMKASEERS